MHISKELWSSTRAWSHSVWMLSWSCPHMAWWFSLILFSWASVQRLPWLSLWEACDLFWYFFWAVQMVTWSVSQHVMQSLEAVSISESATSSLDESESDEAWSPVILELPATVPSAGSVVALVGLEWELVGSCPCYCLKVGPASGTNLGMSSLPCAELCSILSSTSWELTLVLLSQWSPSEPLAEQSNFLCVGMARNSTNGHLTGGVPTKGISGEGGTGRGGVPSGWAGLLEGPRASEPSGSDTVVIAGMSISCCVVVASTLLT